MNANFDVWLLELGRGVLSRFTFDPAIDVFPIWSPDGSRIVFSSNRKGLSIFTKSLPSAPEPRNCCWRRAQDKDPTDWSPDGRFLLYRSVDPKTGYDIWALPMDGDRKPFPVVQTNFDERDAQFSPDGKWIAYQSNESGRFEIYIQPFPGPGSKMQVSTNGGAQVRWRPRRQRIVLHCARRSIDGRSDSACFNPQTAEPGSPIPLFATRVGGALQGTFRQQYDVSSDGQRFLMNTITEEAASPITVILNWKPKS